MNKKIFVSYAREDKKVVSPLVDDLKGLRHQVWLDEQLSGGQPWWNSILKEIRDCEVFVMTLTPRWPKSPACLAEFEYARNLRKAVLPVKLADLTGCQLPPSVADIHHTDYRLGDKSALKTLVGDLDRLEPSPALPSPLPADPPLPLSYRAKMTEEVSRPSLSHPDQMQLVMQLRYELRDPERGADARALLEQLQKRPDCSKTIFEDIKQVLADTPVQPADATGSSVSTSQKREDSAKAKPGLLSKIASLIPTLFVIGAVLAGGSAIVYNMLFAPRIEVKATYFDWSPKPVVVGQKVKFTGRYELTYRIRKGWTWDLDEVKGTPLPDLYTALWTIDGQIRRVKDARNDVLSGESAETSIEFTFDQPGLHTVEFDMRAGNFRSSDDKRKIPTQNIAVLAAVP
jgi:hypothetical protein